MNFIKKYKHGFVILIYSILYMAAFSYLEHHVIYNYHIIHTPVDDWIPFCEYFIVPYLLWFPYLIFTVFYFVFINKNTDEYYQLTKNLCTGMTIFLIVSFLYPNGQDLRPEVFARDNVFVDLVRRLYATDTPTNILPSLHVFNSLAAHMAILRCKTLHHRKYWCVLSWILTVSIVLSTMFLKQHSVVDVILGLAMAGCGYLLFYSERSLSHEKKAVEISNSWK